MLARTLERLISEGRVTAPTRSPTDYRQLRAAAEAGLAIASRGRP